MMKSPANLFNKKVLVTGASGFIGSHLCRGLATKVAEIHGVSRTPQTSSSQMKWWQADLEDIASVRTLIRNIKPDLVYHLASNVTGARDLDRVLPTLHSNFVSTVNLLTILTEIGCDRIVLAGSLEEPESDRDTFTPSSPYAAAKWASSAYSRMFYELYQTPIVTAKIFMVYGPEQNSRFLIPSVISSVINGVSPKLSSGKRSIDWVYIYDLISGLIAMADAPAIEGQTIDLGTGNLNTIREVVEQIVTSIDRRVDPLFGTIPDRVNEQIRVANVANSSDRIGWKAPTSLKEGLKATIDWYVDRLQVTASKI
jgi:UDP-glucose 4-epimerase